MTLQDQLDALLEATAYDSTGTKIGAVRQVYVDNGTGKATFATVATGVFSADAIVPLHGARLLDDEVHLDHTRQAVKDSPRLDHTEDSLTPSQEAELLEHYGLEAPWVRGDSTTGDRAQPAADAPVSTPTETAAPAAAPAGTKDADPKASGTTPAAPKDAGPKVSGTTPAAPKDADPKASGTKASGTAAGTTAAASGTDKAPARRRTGSSRIDVAALERESTS